LFFDSCYIDIGLYDELKKTEKLIDPMKSFQIILMIVYDTG